MGNILNSSTSGITKLHQTAGGIGKNWWQPRTYL